MQCLGCSSFCTCPSQKPVARLEEPLVSSTLAVPMVLNLPATNVHIYQLDNVSCSLDKNTNKPHGARHCVCKVNQCAEATKSKTCCWLTIVCPKMKSRSVRGHKEHTYYRPSILQSFLGEWVRSRSGNLHERKRDKRGQSLPWSNRPQKGSLAKTGAINSHSISLCEVHWGLIKALICFRLTLFSYLIISKLIIIF